jgi:hypothetical protein
MHLLMDSLYDALLILMALVVPNLRNGSAASGSLLTRLDVNYNSAMKAGPSMREA